MRVVRPPVTAVVAAVLLAVVAVLALGLPGDDGREVDMRQLILSTRDAYLSSHNVTARPDPHEVAERQRREFRERGWVEHNPPLVDRRKNDPGGHGPAAGR